LNRTSALATHGASFWSGAAADGGQCCSANQAATLFHQRGDGSLLFHQTTAIFATLPPSSQCRDTTAIFATSSRLCGATTIYADLQHFHRFGELTTDLNIKRLSVDCGFFVGCFDPTQACDKQLGTGF